jgi:5-methylthioribose kinase
MNCTVRVATGRRSFIVKQARPWVEKYPQFAAPWDRACREADFYGLTASVPGVASRMPSLLAFDPDARVLVLEDLGGLGDYTAVYGCRAFSEEEVEVLAGFLEALHGIPDRDGRAAALVNREMRELNHAHLFEIPLAVDNGLNLDAITPGLDDVARPLKHDGDYGRAVRRLGREWYLGTGRCLIHGDFFPGSLLRTTSGPKVIDPEFGHFGRPEFDWGVFLAHLYLSDQPAARLSQWMRRCRGQSGLDVEATLSLAGVEIMRRLIGYAQLPLRCGLDRKRELLERSRELVLRPGHGTMAGSE